MLNTLIQHELEGDPADEVVRFDGQWMTRGWMRDVADALNALLDAQNLPFDAPIAFAPHSRPEWSAALMGLFARERPIVMIYSYQSSEAIAAKIAALRPPAAILDAGQWTEIALAAAREAGTAAIGLSRTAPYATLLSPWSDTANQRKLVGARGVDLLTSGTTGTPKHFHLSYEWMYARMVVANAYGATAERTPLLSFFPPSNISGLYLMLPVMAAGHPMVMAEKFSVADWIDYVRTYRPKTMGLPVAGLQMILDADVNREAISSLEYVSSGASTLDPSLRKAFEAHFGIPVLVAYGATEFGGVVTAMLIEERLQYGDAKADSVGRPLPGVKLRVRDVETGEVLGPSQEGVLEVMPVGMGDLWIATTDLAMIDQDGFLYHRGRLDGAIMRGGFKVLPEQIMEALMTHPAVRAAAVVGLPDPRVGAVPAALIEPHPGSVPSAEELDAHLRKSLPAPAIPKHYRFTDALPRTMSLKPDLKAAAEFFAE
jgi:long-chain acyl-CoA synthetase